MDKRGKAYRLWTAYLKYVSRINRNLYYWRVKDENAPRGYRDAKNWKELDADPESKVKLYKKASKPWRDSWKHWDSHQKVKKTRKEFCGMVNGIMRK